ncbi:MAG: RecX family transcriptional regulator, partial [Duncaniella sp.]|nr:RecX family transcriptional regulator [Duncaniella sp.]
CTPELRKKLAAWGIFPAETDRIIRKLEEMRFVDDARFARAYAHDKLAYSGWGRNKIIQGLWAKRLDREYIDASMDDIDDEEYESVCRRVISSKIRLSKDGLSTYESKMKILRYAVQRGFETRLAGRIINEIAREERDEE